MGYQANQIWFLKCETDRITETVNVVQDQNNLKLWHEQLGHVNITRLKTAVNQKVINGVENLSGEMPFCDACVLGKQTRKPFKGSAEIQSTEVLQLVHSDVCGPTSVDSLGGAKYFLTFTDDYSRFCHVYMPQRKSDVFQKFKEYEVDVSNFTGRRIKALRADNGGEYTSVQYEAYLKSKGIRHETTTPFTPQQNGVSERLNRNLQEMALSQLQHARLPREFWAESVSTACYVRNRLAVASLGVLPFERWYGRKPTMKHLRVFGCTVFALNPNPYRRKIEAKSEQMRFVGYQKGTKGYRLYDEKSKHLVIRRDVVFKEVNFKGDESTITPVEAEPSDIMKIGKDAHDPNLQPDFQDDVLEAEINDSDVDKKDASATTRRSGRVSRKPNCLGVSAGEKELEFLDLVADSNDVQHCLFFHSVCEPQTIEERSFNICKPLH